MQTAACCLWGLHIGAPESPARKSLAVYRVVMECGVVRWGARIRTMARPDGLEPTTDPRPCPACRHGVGAWHWVTACP